MALSPDEERRRIIAWGITETDAEAGAIVGLDRQTFFNWRKSRGLPAKTRGGTRRRLSDDEERRRLAVYGWATSDDEGAAALGIPRSQYSSWRQVRGLPGHRRRGNKLDHT